MKIKSFITFFLFAGMSSVAFSADTTVTASVDSILAAKRVVISPITYNGAPIIADMEDAPNTVCKFLGFSHAEFSDMIRIPNRFTSLAIVESAGVRITNGYGYSNYFTALTCIK